MKHGETVHIRLNPEDVMGCIDVCKVSDVVIPGMSLAQAVRLALSGLLESARKGSIIPRRDGYEYDEMIRPFMQGGRNGRKLQISKTIELAEINRVQSDIPSSIVNIPPAATSARNVKLRRLGPRIDELNMKKDMDAENFTDADQMELDKLIKELNG